MSDDIRDLGLVKHYEKFKDAIFKNFHVNIHWISNGIAMVLGQLAE